VEGLGWRVEERGEACGHRHVNVLVAWCGQSVGPKRGPGGEDTRWVNVQVQGQESLRG
jgi:hypothetical protein